MGAYHYRCLVTGISLRMADGVCVFVQRVGDAWRPASLPMRGPFNGTGTIRDAERSHDYQTQQVVQSFEDAVKHKRIGLERDARSTWKSSQDSGLDRILETVERTATGHGAVMFRDAAVSYTRPLAEPDEALLIMPEPAPTWLTEHERHEPVITFEFR